MILLMALFVVGRLVQCPRNYRTTEGTIQEAKVAIAYGRDGGYGGAVYYRIEVRVRYDQDGQMLERWLTASDATPARQLLEAKLSSHPRHCVVYWTPRRPEGAQCRLP
jgi:hypothetical protein